MKIKAKSISNISGTLFFSILFSMFFLISTSYAQEAYITTDRNSYEDGDTIKISGNVGKLSETNPNTAVTVIITGPTGKIFEIAQVTADTSGQFSHNVMADGSMQVNGIYEVIAAYGAEKISTTFSFTASAYTLPPTSSSINVEGFSVSYQITGGSVFSIAPDLRANSLIIQIFSSSNGHLTITLPRALIDAKIESADDEFFVLVDGIETDFEETKTSKSRTLTITFKDGTEEIEIIGTGVFGNLLSPEPTTEEAKKPE